MIEIPKVPTVLDLAASMGDCSLSALDNDKLDIALRLLADIAGHTGKKELTRKEQIGEFIEAITSRLEGIRVRLENTGGRLTTEESTFIGKFAGFKDRLQEEIARINSVNIEIFKTSTKLGEGVDDLIVRKAINYANDLMRAKINETNYDPKIAIETLEGPVDKAGIGNSARCYDTAFTLIAGKHYSSLLSLLDKQDSSIVQQEIQKVGGVMFEALKAYLKEKHGEGAVKHLDDTVKAFWIKSFRETLIEKLQN